MCDVSVPGRGVQSNGHSPSVGGARLSAPPQNPYGIETAVWAEMHLHGSHENVVDGMRDWSPSTAPVDRGAEAAPAGGGGRRRRAVAEAEESDDNDALRCSPSAWWQGAQVALRAQIRHCRAPAERADSEQGRRRFRRPRLLEPRRAQAAAQRTRHPAMAVGWRLSRGRWATISSPDWSGGVTRRGQAGRWKRVSRQPGVRKRKDRGTR